MSQVHVTGAWPVARPADAAAALNGSLAVNLKGALDGGGSALPYLKARRSGHIINLFAVSGHMARTDSTVHVVIRTAACQP
jgi:NADP-dependent 3-hydroxy acid dehydrogenase YdfG